MVHSCEEDHVEAVWVLFIRLESIVHNHGAAVMSALDIESVDLIEVAWIEHYENNLIGVLSECYVHDNVLLLEMVDRSSPPL